MESGNVRIIRNEIIWNVKNEMEMWLVAMNGVHKERVVRIDGYKVNA